MSVGRVLGCSWCLVSGLEVLCRVLYYTQSKIDHYS